MSSITALNVAWTSSAGRTESGDPQHPSIVRVISRGSTSAKHVALTFDAGADRGYAALILHTLERNRIHATFGMTGRWAQSNADLVHRMARDHDQLINHTYDHRSFTGLSTQTTPLTLQQRQWEIAMADQVIQRISGHSTKPYFRPPYGDYDSSSLKLLGALGYRYMIMWTVDSLGWEHLATSAIIQRCLAGTGPGTILLMHVGSQSQDAYALHSLIPQLRRRGYRFQTVAQLLGFH